MAIDNKYGQVILEHGDIGEDEPVIVFRAKDKFLLQIIQAYHTLCRAGGSPTRHLDLIQKTFNDVRVWQTQNSDVVKVPDSEASRAWMD